MIIYNGLAMWLSLEELKYFPHGGGESTVNYLVGCLKLSTWSIPFWWLSCPIVANHNFLYFELKIDISNTTNFNQPSHHTTIHSYVWSLLHILSTCQAHLSSLDSSLSLENLNAQLTHILHSATISSFPHTKHSKQGRVGSMPHNRWYDEDCRDLY